MRPGAISLTQAAKRYGSVEALRPTDLEVHPGELFAVLGPSGCGKTTMLRLIAGFERPSGGSVRLAGEEVAGPSCFVAPERRRVGMVFQDFALFPHLTVGANVAFGLGRRRDSGARVRTVLELVGLEDKAGRHPHELSGGERQRVALARALAPEPRVVLLDEPFSSLDATLRADLRREVELILRDAGATAMLVTHDQEEALSLADRIAVMRAGRIVQVGAPEEVYLRPADEWTAQFVGEVNILRGVVGADGIDTEIGRFNLPAGAEVGRTVRVAVRPEQLELALSASGNATVEDRDFRGHDVVYRVRHELGRTVLVQRPSVELLEVGASVRLRPGPSPVAPVHD